MLAAHPIAQIKWFIAYYSKVLESFEESDLIWLDFYINV